MRLQACLNGAHGPDDERGVPITPAELAVAAADAVRAGADGVHLHPKTADGRDDLSARTVRAAVVAVGAAVPGVEIGVTTGAWAAADAEARHAAVEAWASPPRPPDAASVNWHEDGSPALAALLLDLGIGVEAGLWTPDAARGFARPCRTGPAPRPAPRR